MGSKNNRKKKKNENINLQNSKIDKSNEINKVKSLLLFKNEELLNFPPPIFKNLKSNNIDHDFNIKYYIYKLKNINNAFYILFLNYDNGISIYKFYYEKKMIEKINIIKINSSFFEEIMIRYIYNDFDKKEYLFVEKGPENLFIYLIKDEKNYELINKEECNDYEFDDNLIFEYGRNSNPHCEEIKEINLFEAIYNQFDKNIYIINFF